MAKVRKIKGYSGFWASESGKIYREFLGIRIEVRGTVNKRNGYLQIWVRADSGKWVLKTIHRLIAETWILNPFNKPEVNHKRGNKLDNRVKMLEWSTYSENTQHAYDAGLCENNRNRLRALTGEAHPRHKITDNQVESVRELYLTGKFTYQELALLYSLGITQVSRIVKHQSR